MERVRPIDRGSSVSITFALKTQPLQCRRSNAIARRSKSRL